MIDPVPISIRIAMAKLNNKVPLQNRGWSIMLGWQWSYIVHGEMVIQLANDRIMSNNIIFLLWYYLFSK